MQLTYGQNVAGLLICTVGKIKGFTRMQGIVPIDDFVEEDLITSLQVATMLAFPIWMKVVSTSITWKSKIHRDCLQLRALVRVLEFLKSTSRSLILLILSRNV